MKQKKTVNKEDKKLQKKADKLEKRLAKKALKQAKKAQKLGKRSAKMFLKWIKTLKKFNEVATASFNELVQKKIKATPQQLKALLSFKVEKKNKKKVA
jgi:hypothetical protein